MIKSVTPSGLWYLLSAMSHRLSVIDLSICTECLLLLPAVILFTKNV